MPLRLVRRAVTSAAAPSLVARPTPPPHRHRRSRPYAAVAVACAAACGRSGREQQTHALAAVARASAELVQPVGYRLPRESRFVGAELCMATQIRLFLTSGVIRMAYRTSTQAALLIRTELAGYCWSDWCG